MSKVRASVFGDDDLDVSGFMPEPAPDKGPDIETILAVSEQSQFPSREPKHLAAPGDAPKRQPRRHRTGRTAQFNARTTPVTVQQFYAIADRNGWLVGETVERALAALQRELGEKG